MGHLGSGSRSRNDAESLAEERPAGTGGEEL